MADITPVALGIKVPDAMQTLGSVLGAANAQQAYKTSQFDLAKKQATLESDIARNKAETSTAETGAAGAAADLAEKTKLRELAKNGFQEYLGADGTMDFNKLVPAAMAAAPTKGPEFVKQMYDMHTAFTGAKKSLLSLNNDQRATAAQVINTIGDDSPEVARKKLDGLVELMPQVKPAVDSAWKYHLEPASKNPEAFKGAASRVAQGVMSIPQQNEATTPGGASFDNGQQSGVINVKPMAGPQGVIAPTVVQHQLPPTTPEYDPNTQTPGLVGPQPGTSPVPLVGPAMTPATVTPGARIPPQVQQSRDSDALRIVQEERAKMTDPEQIALADREIARLSKGPVSQQFAQRRVQTGPALGTSGNIEGTVAANNKDFGETQEAAGKASGNIANLQKIKEYAKGATVGTGADRRALANGIGDLLGIPSSEIGKTNTDLLAKHANMLALTGGNTDSARALAEAANPNIHMNEAAIRKAADYIIALQKTAIEKQKFLQPFKAMNDPNQYQSALKEWNANADPRVLQLLEMSPEEKKQMFGSMSANEYAEFKRKALRLHEMGVGK